ncbi:hypothetical protein TUM17561_14680 [Enterobacter cloacae]|jgi:hypothetical protein|nr:hypothetical protein TUM17561_14680 [Enterobacter cloacae]GLH25551.1 hypothetical protein ENT52713_29470 [Enterobacter sp. 200527-13]
MFDIIVNLLVTFEELIVNIAHGSAPTIGGRGLRFRSVIVGVVSAINTIKSATLSKRTVADYVFSAALR